MASLFVTLAHDHRTLAACFWAACPDRPAWPAALVDFVEIPVDGDPLVALGERLDRLCGNRSAAGKVFAVGRIAAHARAAGFAAVAVGGHVLDHRPALVSAVASWRGSGHQIDPGEHDLAPLLGDLKIDAPPDALADAVLIGIALMLGVAGVSAPWSLAA